MTEEEMKARIAELETERDTALNEKKTALGEKFKANKATEALQAQLTEATENAKNANLDELTKAQNEIKKLNSTIEQLTTRATSAEDNLRSYRTDNEIAKLLVQHKVQNEDHDIVSSYIRAMTKWDDDGNLVAQDKPLTDFAKDYFSGAGKRYTALPDNSGGGSTGNNGKTPPRMTAENWNWTEFAKIQIENPAEADALAKAAGKAVNNGS